MKFVPCVREWESEIVNIIQKGDGMPEVTRITL